MQQRINLKEENASESKEKRKKRLARNRESARQSRRRKKELLLNLRKQVNDLHDQIENERRRKLEHMEMEVSADRIRILNEIFLDQRYHGQSVEGMDRFTSTVRHSGPNSKERRAAVSFQFKELRKLVLPFYLQIFLSMSLKERSYFTEAKENKIKEVRLGVELFYTCSCIPCIISYVSLSLSPCHYRTTHVLLSFVCLSRRKRQQAE